MLVGILYGLLGYLLYYYFFSFPEFEHRYFRFETRIVQYPLFGATFGYVYYQLKLRANSSFAKVLIFLLRVGDLSGDTSHIQKAKSPPTKKEDIKAVNY